MSLFTFRALDSQGVTQRGTLQAKDQSAAIAAAPSALPALTLR